MDDTGDEVATGHEYLELKRMLKAMGDVHRLDILHVLAGRTETNVTDLAEILVANGRYISQPLVSWHLNMLRRASLVRTRRTGRQVYCSLDRASYQRCLRMLGDIISGPAPVAATSPDTQTSTVSVAKDS
jgi:ArsR family transcriptional regulator, arsenate/arsenite/antimonite-responsive transcriptional repressor